ncbi:hypothetical protein RIF29_33952 [Crotalaria pallida]|uniref:Uncharacterized protein n=1 Tax=Crotalaria pallida TaxID=3830 RepID=A0AAN9EAM1_CROPI
MVWLKNLDVIRDRIKGKSRLGHDSNDKPVDDIVIGDGENPNIGSQTVRTDVGENPNMDSQPKTTDPSKVNQWEEKKKPSKNKVEQLDNALKLKDIQEGIVPEENVASAMQVVEVVINGLTDTQ